MTKVPPPPPSVHQGYNYYNKNYYGGHNGNYHEWYNQYYHHLNQNGIYYGGPNDYYYGGYNPYQHGLDNPHYCENYNDGRFKNMKPVGTKLTKNAEDWFKNNFSNIHNLMLAIKNISALMDNSFALMKSTFRVVLSVAEYMKKFKNIVNFKYIWNVIKLYKQFRWLHIKLMKLLGCKVLLDQEDAAVSHTEDIDTANTVKEPPTELQIIYEIMGFLGIITSISCLISTFVMSKSEGSIIPGSCNSDNGYFDFILPRKHLSIEQPEKTPAVAKENIESNLKDQLDKPLSAEPEKSPTVAKEIITSNLEHRLDKPPSTEPEKTPTEVKENISSNLEDQLDKPSNADVLT